MRRVFFWAHLLTGLTIGVVVLLMAATGVLLTYQRQIQYRADTRGLDVTPPAASAQPLAPAELLTRVRAQTDAPITGIRWRRSADAPVELLSGRERVLFADGYTGIVLGEGSRRTREFFRAVTGLHRWLALRDVKSGRAITGAANLAFLFMVCSGLYLWWPRRPSRRAFRNAMLFRRGLRAKARDFNWHTVIGFWSSLPLLAIIASAVVTSYAWAGVLIERVAGSTSAAPAAVAGGAPTVESGRELDLGAQMLERARATVPEWKSITLELPVRRGAAVFIIDTGTGGQPHRQARLTLAAASGDVVAWQPFSSGARAARVREVLRYLHTGEVAGIPGQTVAGLVSAGVTVLVITGASLALRRLAAWRRRRARAVAPDGAGLP